MPRENLSTFKMVTPVASKFVLPDDVVDVNDQPHKPAKKKLVLPDDAVPLNQQVEVTVGEPQIAEKPKDQPESNYLGSPAQFATAAGVGAVNSLMGQTLPQAISIAEGFKKQSGVPEYSSGNPNETDGQYLRNKLLHDALRFSMGTREGMTKPLATFYNVVDTLKSDTGKNREKLKEVRDGSKIGGTVGDIAGSIPSVLAGAPAWLIGLVSGVGANEKVSQGDVSPESLAGTAVSGGVGALLGKLGGKYPAATSAAVGVGAQGAKAAGYMDPKEANIATGASALGVLPAVLSKIQASRYNKGIKNLENTLGQEDTALGLKINKDIDTELESDIVSGVLDSNRNKGNPGGSVEGAVRPPGFDQRVNAAKLDLANKAKDREIELKALISEWIKGLDRTANPQSEPKAIDLDAQANAALGNLAKRAYRHQEYAAVTGKPIENTAARKGIRDVLEPDFLKEGEEAAARFSEGKSAALEKIKAELAAKAQTEVPPNTRRPLSELGANEIKASMQALDKTLNEEVGPNVGVNQQLLLEVAQGKVKVPGFRPDKAKQLLKGLGKDSDMSVEAYLKSVTDPHKQPPLVGEAALAEARGESLQPQTVAGRIRKSPVAEAPKGKTWGNIDLAKEKEVTSQLSQADFLKATSDKWDRMPDRAQMASRINDLKGTINRTDIFKENLKSGGLTGTNILVSGVKSWLDPRVAVKDGLDGRTAGLLAKAAQAFTNNPALTARYGDALADSAGSDAKKFLLQLAVFTKNDPELADALRQP